jgi:hypothetical protein
MIIKNTGIEKTVQDNLELKTKDDSFFAAANAGLSRVAFYKTDTWVLENMESPEKKTFVVPKNTVPALLEPAFLKTDNAEFIESKVAYDRRNFGLIEIPDFENTIDGVPYVIIEYHRARRDIAEVEFRKGSFVINLAKQPKDHIYPFNQYEFLRVVNVAKWLLELHLLPNDPEHADK